MSYRVILNERADAQLEAAYRWWLERRSAEQAARWYNGFLDSLRSLSENPERCALARENAKFPMPVRVIFAVWERALHTARSSPFGVMLSSCSRFATLPNKKCRLTTSSKARYICWIGSQSFNQAKVARFQGGRNSFSYFVMYRCS